MNKITLVLQDDSKTFLFAKISNKLPIRSNIPYDKQLEYDSQNNPSRLRIYGSSGEAMCDYDFNDHKRPKYHHFPKHNGAHKHYYYYENGETKRTTALELTEEEYIEFVKPYI